MVLIQHVGLIGVGPTPKAARLSRDLYHRAIEVMAGAHALGGFVSLDADESFAIEYWPLELYKLSLAPPPGELQGQVALVTGAAGGIGGAIVDALAAAGACVVGLRPRRRGRRGCGRVARRRGPVGGDVTSEAAVRAAYDAAVMAFGGVDIVVSNAGIASSAPIEETSLAEWERNHAILGTGYFLVAREAFGVMREQGLGGSIVFIASKNAVVAGRNAAAYSSAKALELHLARCLAEEGGAARDPRQHRQPRRGPAGLADLGLELARGARRRLRDRARRARGALPQAHDPGRQHPPAGHRRGRAALRVAGALGQEHGQHPQRRRGRRGRLPALITRSSTA